LRDYLRAAVIRSSAAHRPFCATFQNFCGLGSCTFKERTGWGIYPAALETPAPELRGDLRRGLLGSKGA